jgi:hypothetical protein
VLPIGSQGTLRSKRQVEYTNAGLAESKRWVENKTALDVVADLESDPEITTLMPEEALYLSNKGLMSVKRNVTASKFSNRTGFHSAQARCYNHSMPSSLNGTLYMHTIETRAGS